jgi:hypothetical protein
MDFIELLAALNDHKCVLCTSDGKVRVWQKREDDKQVGLDIPEYVALSITRHREALIDLCQAWERVHHSYYDPHSLLKGAC